MLKRRKESDTYLTTVCRHCWSIQITMKVDKLLELSASTVVIKATLLAESSSNLSTFIVICLLQRYLQIDVALFPSF
jgi:hypothetical protein